MPCSRPIRPSPKQKSARFTVNTSLRGVEPGEGDHARVIESSAVRRCSAFFAVASAALFTCPLHAQRPLSLLLLLLAFALGRRAPATPGLEWARVVLPVKYLASHPVRAEPYALAEFGKRR